MQPVSVRCPNLDETVSDLTDFAEHTRHSHFGNENLSVLAVCSSESPNQSDDCNL